MLPHTFESGPLLEFKREFRKLWTQYYIYKGSLMKDVRLMQGGNGQLHICNICSKALVVMEYSRKYSEKT